MRLMTEHPKGGSEAMNKIYTILILLFCLLFTASTAAAKEDRHGDEGREDEAREETTEEEPKTDITGYGEYVLGTDISDIDLSDFEGPIRDTSYEDLEAYSYIQVGRDFHHSVGSTDITLFLSFVDDRLSMISLDFSDMFLDFDDLDSVSRFVRGLRSTFLEKYDRELVKSNTFFFDYSYSGGWIGLLELEDEEGDIIYIMWNGYDLDIVYSTSEMLQTTKELSEAEEEEEESRL